jgi:hypothetical protein
MKKGISFGLLALCLAMNVNGLSAATWGDLKIQFLLDGKPQVAPPLKADKDPAVCAVKPIPDEKLLVGPTGGIENVIVFLVPEKGSKLEIHPDYEKEKTSAVELDNKACKFTPHVALVRTGQVLKLKNSDPVGHNSKLDFTANLPQNPIIPGSATIEVKDLTKAEKRATPVSCSIHPWMSAWVLVQDHPYMAKSNADGEVVLKNVPAGSFTFQVWHEDLGNISDKNAVDAAGKAVTWSKGKAALTIKAGMNDLGTIKVKK